jgi:hypothetical protein
MERHGSLGAIGVIISIVYSVLLCVSVRPASWQDHSFHDFYVDFHVIIRHVLVDLLRSELNLEGAIRQKS